MTGHGVRKLRWLTLAMVACDPSPASTSTQPPAMTATSLSPVASSPAASPPSPQASTAPNAGATRSSSTAPAPRSGDGVDVPAGPFTMGCKAVRDGKCSAHEQPRHQVHLDAFSVDRTEVTVADYRRCHQAQTCATAGLTKQKDLGGEAAECNWGKSGRDLHPINCVTWLEASTYCNWAGKRLPTEAEWEKAARGSDGRLYPWGNEPADGREDLVVILRLRAPSLRDQPPQPEFINTTWPVGQKPAGQSPYGALDMAGNVWEWTADRYDPKAYERPSRRNPRGPANGTFRVIRGDIHPPTMRSSQRNKLTPDTRLGVLGFRCAK